MPSEFRSDFLILEKTFIPTTNTFNLRETLECGQVFRYQLKDGEYHLSAGEHHAIFKEIEGIGDKKRKALLNAFGSIENIKRASEEELAKVEGIGAIRAKKIKEFFNSYEG